MNKIKSILKSKHSIFSNHLLAIGMSFRTYKKHKAELLSRDYSTHEIEIDPHISIADWILGFFLRVALEYSHKTIIEIGAYTGRRIINLKKLIPDITAYGLDIQQRYKQRFFSHGVNFEYFKLSFFEKGFNNPLAISRGTLAYISPDQINALLKTLYKNNISFALAEPVPLFVIDKTIASSKKTYYHPYAKLLEEHGFEVVEKERGLAKKHSDDINSCETWYHNYAYPKRKYGKYGDKKGLD